MIYNQHFYNAESCAQTLAKLYRVAELNSLGVSFLHKHQAALESMWKDLQTALVSLKDSSSPITQASILDAMDVTRNKIKDILSSPSVSRTTADRITNLYLSCWNQTIMDTQADDRLALEELIQSLKLAIDGYRKDISSAQGAIPFCRSEEGKRGPTLLVDFDRFVTKETKEPYKFVCKWSSLNEFFANRLYQLFLDMPAVLEQTPISVPKFTLLDFDHRLHSTYDGRVSTIEEGVKTALEDTCQKIKNLLTPKDGAKWSDKNILLFERIEGSNLCDFIDSEGFASLPLELKQSLFRKMGALAFLDLFLVGNLDRFAAPYKNEEDYIFDNLENNPYNILIVKKGETLDVVAIDNGTEEELLSKPENRTKYIEFLYKLLQSCDMSASIAQSIADSFRQFNEVAEAPIRYFQGFLNDLDSFGKRYLEEGLNKMKATALQHISSLYNTPSFFDLFQRIDERFPAFALALDERIGLLYDQAREDVSTPMPLSLFTTEIALIQNLLLALKTHASCTKEAALARKSIFEELSLIKHPQLQDFLTEATQFCGGQNYREIEAGNFKKLVDDTLGTISEASSPRERRSLSSPSVLQRIRSFSSSSSLTNG